jgi:hypothetical protein
MSKTFLIKIAFIFDEFDFLLNLLVLKVCNYACVE